MSARAFGPRPSVLTLIGWVSLIWSALSLAGVFVGIFLFAVVGAGSWLGGPVVGALGSLIGLVAIAWLVVGSCLSLFLLSAGWRTLADDPSGVDRHRTWAWISLVLDAVALLLSGGLWASSWWGVIYALFVLHATNRPEVHAYRFGVPIRLAAGKPPGLDDEAF